MTELAKEYAAALFALSCEGAREREYAEALERLSEAVKENPQWTELLSSPAIPMRERLAALEKDFSSLLPQEVLSFVKLLCQKGRIRMLGDAAEEYRRLLEERERIAHAKITSAVPLTQEEQSRLIAALEARENCRVQGEYEIDPRLLGGVIVAVEGKILDGSLRHRLSEIKEVIHS